MKQAIAAADEGLNKVGEGPFGACIVKDGLVLSTGNNRVVTENDPTSHAEIVAIRAACKILGRRNLDDCEIYSTSEPCPMCLGAIYWAHLSKLYYGTSRSEAAQAGFDDEFIYEELGRKELERKLSTTPGVLFDECRELFEKWEKKEDKVRY